MNKYSLVGLLWSFISLSMVLRAIFFDKVASIMGYVRTPGIGEAQIIESVLWTAILIISIGFTWEWWDK